MNHWQQIEQLVAERYPADNEPGCAVLVVLGDETRMFARGIADMQTAAPITGVTNFRLASVAKQFTAACILQLRDLGRLHLGQRLTDFFPDFANYGGGITVENLLRHTSGIKDYEPLVDPHRQPLVMDAEVLQLLAEQDSCDFEPGTRFRYSNSGYAVLAMIVEAISGVSFPDYLQAYIFQPLLMNNTLALVNRPDSPVVPERAIGYKLDENNNFVWADQGSTSAVLGDGGIYCSAIDYEKWIRGYWSGQVLKPETVTEAWQPTKTRSGEVVPYGYGWRLEQQGDKWRPYHPGSTTGFRNGVVLVPEKQFAALVLSNRSNGDAGSLAMEVRRVICE